MIKTTSILIAEEESALAAIIVSGMKDATNTPVGIIQIRQGNQLVELEASMIRNFAASIDFFAGKDSKLGY